MVTKLNSVHHVAIICSDYEKSKHFYTEVLGLTVINETFRPEKNSHKLDLAIGNIYQIELFSFPGRLRRPEPEPLGLRHLAFEVNDIVIAVKSLESDGVAVEKVRTDLVTGKRFTFFTDPDGQPLEIYEK